MPSGVAVFGQTSHHRWCQSPLASGLYEARTPMNQRLRERELPPPEKEFLTTGEAAALCGLARSTIRRAVAHGHLAAWHTPGKFLRFTRSSCLDFANSLGRTDLVGQSHQGIISSDPCELRADAMRDDRNDA